MARISCFDCIDGQKGNCEGCTRYEASLREDGPTTIADKIRAMSDENLALMFTESLRQKELEVIERLQPIIMPDVSFSIINIPVVDYARQLAYLKSRAK